MFYYFFPNNFTARFFLTKHNVSTLLAFCLLKRSGGFFNYVRVLENIWFRNYQCRKYHLIVPKVNINNFYLIYNNSLHQVADVQKIIVIDDVYLKTGKFKLCRLLEYNKGHNGLKNLKLNTVENPWVLLIGVGRDVKKPLDKDVISTFGIVEYRRVILLMKNISSVISKYSPKILFTDDFTHSGKIYNLIYNKPIDDIAVRVSDFRRFMKYGTVRDFSTYRNWSRWLWVKAWLKWSFRVFSKIDFYSVRFFSYMLFVVILFKFISDI